MDRKPILRGKAVILIDDAVMTGATVEACTRALRAGGAAEVHVLTLARVVRLQAVWSGYVFVSGVAKS